MMFLIRPSRDGGDKGGTMQYEDVLSGQQGDNQNKSVTGNASNVNDSILKKKVFSTTSIR